MVRLTALILVVLLGAGCGAQAPTAPAVGPSFLPTISSITPAALKVSSAAQTLTVIGANLQTVTQVLVVSPAGSLRSFTSPSIIKLTTTSFEISLTLEEVGKYSLAVLAGSESANSSFTVSG